MYISNIKHSVMTLYTNGFNDPYSHVVKIALAEKCLEFEEQLIQDNIGILKKLNPYCYTPTFVDRDLVLYKAEIITEYIDERFPHPPLMPINPILKGKTRLLIYRINKDWFKTLNYILNLKNNLSENLDEYKKNLLIQIESAKLLFKEMPYFLSENFSLIDCWISTLLWYLQEIDKNFLEKEKIIYDYSKKIFARNSFQKVLNKKI
ncbi:glutathione S-transferase N-terminal domain-containing protein [Candidatus Azoamicus ciliaticola]|jgi:RNA polymerase-associated protein|uniref:Stringent starvation protein A n=1 Tax=Candidatus Azoamicus ciliaticola TaxID=2652803 RepID=A0A6J5JZ15_9GAMM|nr:glutathione S-transferase N-terminal domain-containing protein [Candidatus Azoamicus ciliaticola]CAB3976349.1 Stringent starvation protein A [Candidatus Azoamicus ciliaticola]